MDKLPKNINPYILNNIHVINGKINLSDYDTTFLINPPYKIHKNMIEYICKIISMIDFDKVNNIYHTLHIEIMKHKGIRLKMVTDVIINNFPYVVDNSMFDDIILQKLIIDGRHIPLNRIPLFLKYFNNVDFSVIEDHQLFIIDELKKMMITTKKINKYLIQNFPSNNSSIVITKRKLGFATHFTTYDFPLSALGILAKELNKINFLECDDIHLTMHNIIINMKKQLVSLSSTIVDVNLSEIYNTFNETNKLRLFNKYHGRKDLYINNNDIIVKSIKKYVIDDGKCKNMTLKKIIFDCKICVLCDKLKIIKCNKFYIAAKAVNYNEQEKLYFCNGFCNFTIYTVVNENNVEDPSNLTQYGYTLYNIDKVWDLRYFKHKFMMMVIDWEISNFGYLHRDIMGVILRLYMKLVL